MSLQSIGSVLAGAAFTSVVGLGGAATGHALMPDGSITAAFGVVTAVAAAMAWVDKRIEKRITDHETLEHARAETRDASLLRKVEKMLNR